MTQSHVHRSDWHPHEPETPRVLDDDGSCLVCRIAVEREFQERLLAIIDEIAAIVDEPLDERAEKGPTRAQQFRRIEGVIRRVRPAPTEVERP